MSLTRRQFLQGDFAGRGAEQRPPWAAPEAQFTARCTRCGDCLAVCPQGILIEGATGFPLIDFSRNACTFCGACAETCKTGAIRQNPQDAPWHILAFIEPSCLALNRVVCRTCGEQCEANAIRFAIAPGGVSVPKIESPLCNGCGACVSACPVRAIGMRDPAKFTQSREAA